MRILILVLICISLLYAGCSPAEPDQKYEYITKAPGFAVRTVSYNDLNHSGGYLAMFQLLPNGKEKLIASSITNAQFTSLSVDGNNLYYTRTTCLTNTGAEGVGLFRYEIKTGSETPILASNDPNLFLNVREFLEVSPGQLQIVYFREKSFPRTFHTEIYSTDGKLLLQISAITKDVDGNILKEEIFDK